MNKSTSTIRTLRHLRIAWFSAGLVVGIASCSDPLSIDEFESDPESPSPAAPAFSEGEPPAAADGAGAPSEGETWAGAPAPGVDFAPGEGAGQGGGSQGGGVADPEPSPRDGLPSATDDGPPKPSVSGAGGAEERAWPDGRRRGVGWPEPNDHSWDGSVNWPTSAFPRPDMLDAKYRDGHLTWWGEPSPVLPPGDWDWKPDDGDLANWRNFRDNIGHFQPLYDEQARHFGWRVASHDPAATKYNGPSHYYRGSGGADVLNLGPGGAIHSFTVGELGDGPDLLVFERSWSLAFRTGGTQSDPAFDNDLVVAGCTDISEPMYAFETSTIHTGPGRDWIFARNMRAAAIDAGNGEDGLTSALDPGDGDDWVMLHGYMKDVRVFGGVGDDVVFWHLDEMQGEDISFFGPNFFGEGGSGEAVWAEGGTDRFVLGIPPDTQIVDHTPTPPGGLLVRIWAHDSDEIWWDEPMYHDPYARYCITCGTSPTGRKTMNLEYLSADESVFTGWFWVTNFEELQLGVGPDAVVYRIDDVNGVLVPAPDLEPITPPEYPWWYCEAALHPEWPTAAEVDPYQAP